MNYNIRNLDDPAGDIFARRFSMQLWLYTVNPRVDEPPYSIDLDFASDPLNGFVDYYQPIVGDTLEIFTLDKRVLFTGIEIAIDEPAEGLRIQPVANSGQIFDEIDCSTRSRNVYRIGGGIVDRATDLAIHSRLIEYPDYVGLKITQGSIHLPNLAMRMQLAVNDTFPWDSIPNYVRR